MTNEEKFRHILQTDPIRIFKLLWPGEPSWEKQDEIIRSVWRNKYTAVRSGNGVGKSHCAARVVIGYLYAWPHSKVITTAPTWEQVIKILWSEIRRQYSISAYPLGGKLTETELEIGPEWRAFGLSTNQATRFLGHHAKHILVVMDEAAGVSEEIDQATKSLLTSENAKILKIGNPIDASGHFYDCFTTTGSALWHTIHISCLESPNFHGKVVNPKLTTPQWVEERKLEYGSDSPWYQCFVLGEFPAQSDDSLISLAWVLAAQRREKATDDGRRAIGVDVARFGSDETVIVLYDRGRFEILDHHQGQDTMTTTGRVKQFHDKYKCPVGVDDIGVGGGVTDRLRELEVPVLPFIANERPVRYGKYGTRSAGAMWTIREGLRLGKFTLPDDERLTAQLVGRKYKIASDGQIELERKDDMKKRGLRSPDRADALAIAYDTAQYYETEALQKPKPDITQLYRELDEDMPDRYDEHL